MHNEDNQYRDEDFDYVFSDEPTHSGIRDNLFFSQDPPWLIFSNVTGALNDYFVQPTISRPQPAPNLSTVEPWLTQLSANSLPAQPKSPDNFQSPNSVPLHRLSPNITPSSHLFPNELDGEKSLRNSDTKSFRKRPATDPWGDTGVIKKRKQKAKSEQATEVADARGENKKDQHREELLARNRVAASKCRQKKKELIAELEERARDLAALNKVLHVTVATLKNDMLDLKDKCLQHMSCECEGIRQYLARSVMCESSMVPAAPDLQDWDQDVDELLRASETSNSNEASDVTPSTTEVTHSMDSSSVSSPRPNPLSPSTTEPGKLKGWQVPAKPEKSSQSHHP